MVRGKAALGTHEEDSDDTLHPSALLKLCLCNCFPKLSQSRKVTLRMILILTGQREPGGSLVPSGRKMPQESLGLTPKAWPLCPALQPGAGAGSGQGPWALAGLQVALAARISAGPPLLMAEQVIPNLALPSGVLRPKCQI